MNPKIIGNKSCIRTQKVLIAAECVSCRFDFVESASGFSGIVTSNGCNVSDVKSALRYFARMRPDVCLYGRVFDDAVLVDNWMEFVDSALPEQGNKAGMSEIESHLLQNTFLAGERITIADISVFLTVHRAMSSNADLLKTLPCVQRWFNTMMAHCAVKKHFSAAKCSKAAPAKPCKKENKEPAGADVEDQIAAEAAAAKKKVNPLDLLPASPLNLDAWKREYSNSKDLRGQSMDYFWKNFDAAGWSLWYMKYDKVEGEGKVAYTTANMLGGFLQRLDNDFRKYSFAVLNVVGQEGDFDIQGVWMMRGQEIPFQMVDHPSFEYQKFRKLDINADKALIEDYWCNEDAVEGRPIDSAKVWK